MKWFGRNGGSLILWYYAGIRLEGLRITTKPLREGMRSLGRYLNPGPPEYVAGVLTTTFASF
jgi:hypothetical protein